MPLKDMLFSFHGRIRRRDWWLCSIALVLVQMLATRLTDTVLFGPTADLQAGAYIAWFFAEPPVSGAHWSGLALGVVFLWPALALTLKRARDRNRRGRELVAIQLAGMTGYLLPNAAFESARRAMDAAEWLAAVPVIAWVAVVLIASLYQLVRLGFLEGTRGPNRFGQSPKSIGGGSTDTTADVFS